MMSGKRWSYVVQFFCLLVFLGMSPFLIKMDGRKTMSVSSDSVRSQNVSDEVKPVVALTFDDGPNASSTPILLDGLKERKVRATFFLIGENVEKDENEKIVKRMYEEGHLIGNHTYRHVDLSKISGREAEKEIKTTDEAIKKITGHETEFIRPPFGAMPEGEEDPDKIYVKWTVDSLDWVTKDTEKIVEKVTADTKEGDVILMHDCYGESVEAALQIVDIMEKQGYEFVTADELIIN